MFREERRMVNLIFLLWILYGLFLTDSLKIDSNLTNFWEVFFHSTTTICCSIHAQNQRQSLYQSLSKSDTERSTWLKSIHSYWFHEKEESKPQWEQWDICLDSIGSWKKMRSTWFIWGFELIVFYMKIYCSHHRELLNFNRPLLPSYSIKPAESQTLVNCRVRASPQPQ